MSRRRRRRAAAAASERACEKRLRGEGRALLYISHKLDEVKRLCDHATILRGGKKISTCDPRLETAASLARMMVGAEIGEVKAAMAREGITVR